ncbi:hypothetical protein BKA65DRAFT_389196, partial [Rhexocercosporidium sp. MPI-PUGE-AT-0058]
QYTEKSLQTHDIAIPLPKHNHDESHALFLLLALSPSDLQSPASAMERIQHLYHHTGGRDVGVLFLLNEKTPKVNGTIAMMELQVSLFSILEMPIIPLYSLPSLSAILSTFHRQLINKYHSAAPPPINPAVSLLSYCTNNPPLPEHARNVVSDICHSLSEVSSAATSESGQLGLKNWLDERVPGAAQDIIHFWAEEVLVY